MQNAPLGTASSLGPTASSGGDIVIEATRPRQTERPRSPFS